MGRQSHPQGWEEGTGAAHPSHFLEYLYVVSAREPGSSSVTHCHHQQHSPGAGEGDMLTSAAVTESYLHSYSKVSLVSSSSRSSEITLQTGKDLCLETSC